MKQSPSDISVLYEDNQLLIINKPPGVVVNRAQTVKGETVQDWAERTVSNLTNCSNLTNETNDFYRRSGIVHRIDKETSGVLLIAKTPEAFANLQRQFKERLVKKTYLALVHGTLEPSEGEIRAPVGRLPWNRERFGIVPGGKDAVTNYVVRSVISRQVKRYSFVELSPETGRTHQIRIHLKYINHPIVGDYLYAGRKTSRDDRTWAPRVMLHAFALSFFHPDQSARALLPDGRLAIEAPIPDDMDRIIASANRE